MQLDQETDPDQQHDKRDEEVNVGNNGFGSLLKTHLALHYCHPIAVADTLPL